MSGLLPHEKSAFKTALKALHKSLMEPGPVVYEGHEIVPIPAICTGPRKHEWIDGNGNGAIRSPSLRNCVCFYCGRPLKPHPDYPHVVDAETRRKQTPKQASLFDAVPQIAWAYERQEMPPMLPGVPTALPERSES